MPLLSILLSLNDPKFTLQNSTFLSIFPSPSRIWSGVKKCSQIYDYYDHLFISKLPAHRTPRPNHLQHELRMAIMAVLVAFVSNVDLTVQASKGITLSNYQKPSPCIVSIWYLPSDHRNIHTGHENIAPFNRLSFD